MQYNLFLKKRSGRGKIEDFRVIQSHTHKTDQWQCAVDSQVPSQVHITISLIHQRGHKNQNGYPNTISASDNHIPRRPTRSPGQEDGGRGPEKAGWSPLEGTSWAGIAAWQPRVLRLWPTGPHIHQHDHRLVRLLPVLGSLVSVNYEFIESIVVGWKQNTVLLNAKTAIQKNVRKINNIQVCNCWSVCIRLACTLSIGVEDDEAV